MADDIDIEEHDILDNPLVQDILPQISNIKTEPLDYQENYDENHGGEQSECDMGFIENLLREDEAYTQEEEPPASEDEAADSIEQPVVQRTNNRIILGSKPCPKRKKIKHLSILLEDWGERLNTSPCYCKDCKTLFATRNALDAHNMIAHSFLVALEEPKEKQTDTHKYCNHCQKYFQDDDLLIQHLYDLITAKQAMKDVNTTPVKTTPVKNTPVKSTPVKTQTVVKQVKNNVLSVGTVVPEEKKPTANAFGDLVSCPVCTCHFKTFVKCKQHCVLRHCFSKMEEKFTTFTQQCKVCGIFLQNLSSYNDHVKRQHAELFMKKCAVLKAEPAMPKKVLVKRAKFKCVKCDLAFNTVAAAKLHQHSKHGKQSRVIVIAKKTVRPKRNKRVVDDGLVSKNVLFKCDKCQVHALNCIVAIAHSVNVQSVHTVNKKGLWKCDICKRFFRAVDKELHKLQHEHTKEFKVYVLHENIYSRVLCRCPKCHVYFEERPFMRHTKHVCGKTTEVKHCDICEVTVNNMPIHNKKHELRSFIKSDFIRIDEFVSPSNRYAANAGSLKRKLVEPPTGTVEAKRQKTDTAGCVKEIRVRNSPKYLVYYCNTCHTFITPPDKQLRKRQLYHAKQKCLANRKHYPCKICGLVFNASVAKHLHHSKVHAHGNVSVKDFYFQRITDSQPCVPRIPVLPKCPKCGVHYLANVVNRHSCVKGDRLVCKICKKTFDKETLKLHMLHHKYMGLTSKIEEEPKKKTDRNTVRNTVKNPVKKTLRSSKINRTIQDSNINSTLKMRYQKLIPTWNILYNCKMCDVTTDHYDYVVEHCQKHYNKLESYNVTIQQCEMCLLRFESDCFNRHNQLHDNRNIDRNDFKILQYDWYALLTVSWTKIFEPLPKEEVNQILSRSIYVTPAVKMTLIVDGPPEYTIYECQSCAKIITAETVIFHAKNGVKCTKNATRFVCSTCNFSFATRFARDTHANVHKKQAVEANSFRVVAFNSPQEKEFNSKLLAEHTEICKVESNTGSQSPIDYEDVISYPSKTMFSTPTGNKYRYYQCQECLCCVAKYSCAMSHNCTYSKCVQCPKCTYYYRPVCMNAHKVKHSRNKDFTKDNIVIVPFNGIAKKSNTWKKCKYCGYSFPLFVFKDHVARVHKPSVVKPLEVRQVQEQDKELTETTAKPSITLFRCRSCHCLFLDKDSLTIHQKDCDPNDFQGVKCAKCGLMFHRDSFSEHAKRCSLQEGKCYQNRPKFNEYHVYKCEKCNVCFTTRLDAKKHVAGNHKNHLEGTIKKCAECGRRFHDYDMSIHSLQHQKLLENNIKDLIVVPIDVPAKKNITKKNVATARKVDDCKTSVDSVVYDLSEDVEVVNDASVKPLKLSKAKRPRSTKFTQYRYLANITTKVLFKCKQCNLHYVNIASWISHCMALHIVVRASSNCSMCGLLFPSRTLMKHEKWHHEITEDSLDPDVEIIIPEEHLKANFPDNLEKVDETPKKIVPAVENEDVIVVEDVSDVSQSSIVEANTPEVSTLKTVGSTPKKHSHKIYKCGQCNIYFMAQSTCYIHMLHHTPMEPKEFIECKLCNLPFKIMSLNIHIRKHHKGNFNLDEVLVEEYSNDGGKTPKIDIYYAADKLQSRLVSTTTIEPVSQSSQPVDSSKDIKELNKNIKSVDYQADSSNAGITNDNVTDLTDKNASPTSINLKIEPTTSNSDKTTNFKVAETKKLRTKLHQCSFCDEKFKSNTSKEFHESLDHLDVVKECQFCKESFNMSILNELHLSIKGDSFKCCLCNGRYKVWEMMQHSSSHNIRIKYE